MTRLGLSALCLALLCACTEQERAPLRVYTAFETEQLSGYKAAFEAAHPDIEIQWVRDSTGVITAKLLAERERPHADVVWGLAATSLELLKQHDVLAPWQSENSAAFPARFLDAADPPYWTGLDGWVTAICFNRAEAARLGIPRPATWRDLTSAAYQGRIVAPAPSSSGTGVILLASWLKLFGEERGWEFLQALHENVAEYTHSGSRPCSMAAAGETVVGLSFDYRAEQLKQSGAPIELIFPSEGIGWDLEGMALVRGATHRERAHRLLEWASSDEAFRLYANHYALVALPNVAGSRSLRPEVEALMVPGLLEFAARQRERILAEWEERFGAAR